MNLPTTIKSLRIENKMTCRQLSRLTGIFEHQIWNIENGKRKASDSELRKIAEALGVSYIYLQLMAMDAETDLKKGERVSFYRW